MGSTLKETLIQKKQELAALEMQLQNSQKPKPKTGLGIFSFFLGVIIVMAGMTAGGLPGVLLGLLIVIAGIVRGVNRASQRSEAQSTIDTLSKKILETKNKIIELENL